MKCVSLIGMATVAVCALTATAQTTVFSNNFDSGIPAQFSGAGTAESVAGFTGMGNPPNLFGGNLLRNDSVGPAVASTLSLSSLPAHSSISVGFLLAAIDSWDSDNGSPAPDYFQVWVDGTQVFQATFAIASGSTNYVPAVPAGLIYSGGSVGWNGSWGEKAYDMTLEPLLQNIPHTGSTATIDFIAAGSGWQGGLDESWGIDNVEISVREVPAPGAAALLGLGGLVAVRRRRS